MRCDFWARDSNAGGLLVQTAYGPTANTHTVAKTEPARFHGSNRTQLHIGVCLAITLAHVVLIDRCRHMAFARRYGELSFPALKGLEITFCIAPLRWSRRRTSTVIDLMPGSGPFLMLAPWLLFLGLGELGQHLVASRSILRTCITIRWSASIFAKLRTFAIGRSFARAFSTRALANISAAMNW